MIDRAKLLKELDELVSWRYRYGIASENHTIATLDVGTAAFVDKVLQDCRMLLTELDAEQSTKAARC